MNTCIAGGCGSQVKSQLWSGHIFHARSCVRRDYPSEVMEIVSYCNKGGRTSRKLVSGKYLSIDQIMSDDIDDIQFRKPFRGFACARMALRARKASSRLLATLDPQSTCHGPRSGPTLAPWCSGTTSYHKDESFGRA